MVAVGDVCDAGKEVDALGGQMVIADAMWDRVASGGWFCDGDGETKRTDVKGVF